MSERVATSFAVRSLVVTRVTSFLPLLLQDYISLLHSRLHPHTSDPSDQPNSHLTSPNMVASSFPADLESFLSSHHLSSTTGFLPSPPPAVSFTNFEFNIWLFTAKSIPKLLWNYPREFRKQVDALPLLLFTESCGNIPQWRLAYCALSYIAQAYVWGATVGRPKDEDEAYDEKVLDYIPANIAIPLRHVAFHLGIQPGLTYSAVCTWNWQRKFPTLSSATQERASNLEPIFSFTNTAEEAHYVVTHVMLESAGGQALKLALEASKAAGEKDGDSLEGVLRDLTGAVTKCKQELSLVKEGLDPGKNTKTFLS